MPTIPLPDINKTNVKNIELISALKKSIGLNIELMSSVRSYNNNKLRDFVGSHDEYYCLMNNIKENQSSDRATVSEIKKILEKYDNE